MELSSVSGILPTWRWWQTSSAAKLQADYDFEDAYNGGNSLKFAGDLDENTNQDVRLYSTKLEVTDKTKLRVAHKGGKGSKVYVEFATQKNYTYGGENARKELTLSDDWTKDEFDLSAWQVRPFTVSNLLSKILLPLRITNSIWVS